jgi:hypothetical protein
MLIVDSSRRGECHQVWRSLRRMLNIYRMDKAYAAEGRPWPNARASVSEPMTITNTKLIDRPGPAGATHEGAFRAAQVSSPRKKNAKRNKRNNRRNGDEG